MGEAQRVAGADVSYDLKTDTAYAAMVVMDLVSQTVIDEQWASGPANFPSIPGLLSFREGPVLLEAARLLRRSPDVFLFDGHGLAHPRRFGLACHLGLLLDSASIGCANSPLVGTYDASVLGEAAGASSELVDDDEVIGMAVRTKQNVKPLFISLGPKITLAEAVDVVLRSTRGFRRPEPLRRAHQLSNQGMQQQAVGAP